MDKKPKLSIKEKEASRPKSLRITGLGAPARQLMSESGRMRLEARKQRRAGNMEGYKELMLRSSMERLAGEPSVKSQAFVDAQEEAKANQPDMAARMRVMMDEFMRNRRRPTASDSTIQDDKMPSDVSSGSGMRPSIFAPYEYKSDALTVMNDPNHPFHNPSTVASLKRKWSIS